MVNLTEILFNRYKNNRLGHFYILRPALYDTKTDQIDDLIENLITSVMSHELKISKEIALKRINNFHPDVLFIQLENDKMRYLVDDFEELISFFNLSRFELSHGFVVIDNADKITPLIFNKLLKTLEEAYNATIFLLDRESSPLIPTVLSRAIILTIPQKSQINNSSSFLDLIDIEGSEKWFQDSFNSSTNLISDDIKDLFLKLLKREIAPFILVDALKRRNSETNQLIKLVIAWKSEFKKGYQNRANLLSEVEWIRVAERYNNSPQERLFSFFSSL